MGTITSHHITICTSCRHTGGICQPGYRLIKRLCGAICAASDAVGDDFEISGTACLGPGTADAGQCHRVCTLGYHATRQAAYLFGDVDPDADLVELVHRARQYADADDRRRAHDPCPDGPGRLVPAPASVIALHAGAGPLS